MRSDCVDGMFDTGKLWWKRWSVGRLKSFIQFPETRSIDCVIIRNINYVSSVINLRA